MDEKTTVNVPNHSKKPNDFRTLKDDQVRRGTQYCWVYEMKINRSKLSYSVEV